MGSACRRALGAAAALLCAAGARSQSSDLPLTTHVPTEVPVGEGRLLTALVPTRPLPAAATPLEALAHAAHAWDVVVAPNQHGLVDAKQHWAPGEPLTEREAWHHYTAARQGVVDSARLLVAFGLLPAAQGGGGALHAAATLGDAGAVRALLTQGTDPDAPGEDGSTPLLLAAAMGRAAAAEVLLEAGAAVEGGAPGHGASPLHAAAAMGHADLVALLLARGADPLRGHPFARTTAAHFAAELDHPRVVEVLCGARAEAARARGRHGATPVHTAADSNATRALRALLRPPCSPEPDALLHGDTTPLYLAAQRGLAEAVRELCAAGAGVDFAMPAASWAVTIPGASEGAGGLYPPRNTEAGNGATALHAAAENGHLAAVDALLRAPCGARQLPSMGGATPLVTAIWYRHPRVALRLLQEGPEAARVEAPVPGAPRGTTALHLARALGMGQVTDAILRLQAQAQGHGQTRAAGAGAAIQSRR